MGMFKVAVDEGVQLARSSAHVPDDSQWTDDKTVDLLSGVVPFGSVLTAPGGRYIAAPLRGIGRAALEGAAGSLAGYGLGGLTGSPEVAAMLSGAGSLAGQLHGNYASRRNVRRETGDYSTFGFRRDKDKQAIPQD